MNPRSSKGYLPWRRSNRISTRVGVESASQVSNQCCNVTSLHRKTDKRDRYIQSESRWRRAGERAKDRPTRKRSYENRKPNDSSGERWRKVVMLKYNGTNIIERISKRENLMEKRSLHLESGEWREEVYTLNRFLHLD